MPSEPVKADPRVGDRVRYEGSSDVGVVLAIDDQGGMIVEWQYQDSRETVIVYPHEARKLVVVPPPSKPITLAEASLGDILEEMERRGYLIHATISSPGTER